MDYTESPDRPPARLRNNREASRSISPAPARQRAAANSPGRAAPAATFTRKEEDRTYGNYGQMAGSERVERARERHHRGRDFTPQELREFERMQPRKQVITDFDTPNNTDDLPGNYHKSNPFASDTWLHYEDEGRDGRHRQRGQHAYQPAHDPYLASHKDDKEDLEMAARRRERRPRDLKERIFFARDRAAELIKRRRLLDRCREIEDVIKFTTDDGITVPDADYFNKVDEAYEVAKTFE